MKTGWTEVSLGDVCELRYGRSLPKAKRSGSGVGVYGSNGQVGSHSDALTSGPTIIIGRKGSFGEVTWSDGPCWPIDTTYYVDASSTSADLRWLYHRTKALPLTQLNRAAAIPGLNREDAYAQRLLLPPPEEQRRIAAILDAAEDLRAKRQEALAKLETLEHSIFDGMFGEQQTDSSKWPRRSLKEVCDRIQIGPFGSLLHKHDYVTGGVPLVNPMHIVGGELRPSPEHTVDPTKHDQLRTYWLEEDDVVMGRRGEMGRCAVVRRDQRGWVCGSGSLYLRADKSQVQPWFLARVLSSPRARHQLERAALGITMPNLNADIVGQFSIRVPPLETQHRFTTTIAGIQVQRSRAAQQALTLDRLKASLHQRAFAGKL